MDKLPGLLLALVLAIVGNVAADAFSRAIGMSPGAISGIMVAILLGLAISNLVGLPERLRPGVNYAVKGVLPIGIVLLGLKLSIVEVGAIGLRALPVLLVTIPTAVLVVAWLARRLGLSERLGTPLVTDIFHADRWDYIYRFKPGRGELQQRRLAVFFEDNKLVRVAGDVTGAEAGEAQAGAEAAGAARSRIIEIEPDPALKKAADDKQAEEAKKAEAASPAADTK